MSERKVVATGTVAGSYGSDPVVVEMMTRGRHTGRYVTRGAGFAGRVAYASVERAKQAVEAHRMFEGWSA